MRQGALLLLLAFVAGGAHAGYRAGRSGARAMVGSVRRGAGDVRGLRQARLTELVVSCDDVPAPLDTGRRYDLRPGGVIRPSDGDPPLSGKLDSETGELKLTNPPAGCEDAKGDSLKVESIPPPRVLDGVYRATGGVLLGTGSLDITFRLDGGGGVVRDIRGHGDSIMPPTPDGATTPCSMRYDLPDVATTLLSAGELDGTVVSSPTAPFVTLAAATGFPAVVPTGRIEGTVLHGNSPQCGAGGGHVDASLVAPENADEQIPGFGMGFPAAPQAVPGCRSTFVAPPIVAVAACFKDEGNGRVSSPDRVRANGIDITPLAGGDIVLEPNGPSITGHGDVDVRVGPVFLYRGRLTDKYMLRSGVVFDVQVARDYSIDDNKIGGLPIKGSVKVTLDRGTTSAVVSVGLPQPLQGANATATFGATNERGLDLNELKVEADTLKILSLDVENLSVKYTLAPSTAQHFDGSATVYLPTTPGRCAAKLLKATGLAANTSVARLFGLGIGGTIGFGIGDGYFRVGANADSVNCYLAYGVFLQRVAVDGGVNPFTMMLGAGFSFGPRLDLPVVGRQQIASLDGSRRITSPAGGGLESTWKGTLKIISTSLAGELTLGPGGADLKADGELSIIPGLGGLIPGVPRSVTHLEGWVDRDAFNLQGTGKTLIDFAPDQRSESVISSEGAAGCRTGIGPRVGWGYRWGDDAISWFGRSCDIGPFVVPRTSRAAQAGGATSDHGPARQARRDVRRRRRGSATGSATHRPRRRRHREPDAADLDREGVRAVGPGDTRDLPRRRAAARGPVHRDARPRLARGRAGGVRVVVGSDSRRRARERSRHGQAADLPHHGPRRREARVLRAWQRRAAGREHDAPTRYHPDSGAPEPRGAAPGRGFGRARRRARAGPVRRQLSGDAHAARRQAAARSRAAHERGQGRDVDRTASRDVRRGRAALRRPAPALGSSRAAD